ncbi:UNVERIFIED_CONTAM: hypothetical protein FKN15_077678 [Acipenser sinensis]
MLKVLFLSVLALASALQCPDGGMCSDDNTCCKIPSGGYSCCPLLNDISSFPMVQTGSLNDISGSVCPDNSPCPSEYSCLLTPTGEYGCCPFPQDISSFPMVQTGSLNDISGSVCPDNSPCPSEYSCLLTPTGEYGCCPFPQGLSCADGKHCCPDGYKCSDGGSSCTRHTEVSIVDAVICPDKESECPDETTCCELPDGSWGCCPMVKAVCCDDKVHCCPEGTRCDIAHSKCLSHESETPMWGKLLARKRAAWENDKDMQTKCPSDTTCCEMPSGSYGCCPMPQRYKVLALSLSAFGLACVQKFDIVLKKECFVDASGVQCDDARSCADGSTCCKTRAGGWACCSLPKLMPLSRATCSRKEGCQCSDADNFNMPIELHMSSCAVCARNPRAKSKLCNVISCIIIDTLLSHSWLTGDTSDPERIHTETVVMMSRVQMVALGVYLTK